MEKLVFKGEEINRNEMVMLALHLVASQSGCLPLCANLSHESPLYIRGG